MGGGTPPNSNCQDPNVRNNLWNVVRSISISPLYYLLNVYGRMFIYKYSGLLPLESKTSMLCWTQAFAFSLTNEMHTEVALRAKLFSLSLWSWKHVSKWSIHELQSLNNWWELQAYPCYLSHQDFLGSLLLQLNPIYSDWWKSMYQVKKSSTNSQIKNFKLCFLVTLLARVCLN